MTIELEKIRASLTRLRSLQKIDDAWNAASTVFSETCDNTSTMAAVIDHVDAQAAEIERLKRGEFICQKCGLRKDSDHPRTHEF